MGIEVEISTRQNSSLNSWLDRRLDAVMLDLTVLSALSLRGQLSETPRPPREIKRRADVAGVLPDPERLLGLETAALMEPHNEWVATNRSYLAGGSLRGLTQSEELEQGVTRHLKAAQAMETDTHTGTEITPHHRTSFRNLDFFQKTEGVRDGVR